MSWINALYDWVLGSALSVWALVAAFGLSLVDGFFPPVPSESIITALSAVFIKEAPGRLVPLGALAAVGAFCGDNIAYLIGRRLQGLLRKRPSLDERVREAAAKIEKRGATLIIPARFIPVGRVFVNMGAGLARFPHPRFMMITALSASLWAVYAVLIGVAAGHLIEDNPLLGAAIGVVLGIAMGLVIDRVSAWRASRSGSADEDVPQGGVQRGLPEAEPGRGQD